MKVIQQTATLLKLRERPVGIWLLSAFTALIGLYLFIGYEPPVDLLGFGCITCANFMMFFSPVKTCIFNKNLNWVIFKQKGWLGTQVRSCSLEQVTDIKIEESNLIGTRFYRLLLMLGSGNRFYLTHVPSTDRNLQTTLANYIQRFIRTDNSCSVR